MGETTDIKPVKDRSDCCTETKVETQSEVVDLLSDDDSDSENDDNEVAGHYDKGVGSSSDDDDDDDDDDDNDDDEDEDEDEDEDARTPPSDADPAAPRALTERPILLSWLRYRVLTQRTVLGSYPPLESAVIAATEAGMQRDELKNALKALQRAQAEAGETEVHPSEGGSDLAHRSSPDSFNAPGSSSSASAWRHQLTGRIDMAAVKAARRRGARLASRERS